MTTPRALVLALLLTACADLTGPGVEFEEAWGRWQGAGLTDYQYDVQVLCFCILERTRTVHVTVSGGATVSLVYTDSLTAADSAMFDDVRTMDRLFAELRHLLEQDPHRFEATYHPSLGYPLTVSVDPVAQYADEEVYYRVSNFSTPVP